MTAVELRNVSKSFGSHPVCRDVNLAVGEGEFVTLLGSSGCGKTTTLNMIAGLEDASSGDILMNGQRVNDLSPVQRDVAMVFQNYALYPHMTVAQNIGFTLKMRRLAAADIRARVEKVATSLELSALLERLPAQLSGGQQQRVAIGRALVREPRVFLFDEPFSNLDAKLRVAMRSEVRRLHRDLGVTSVFVTHDQTEAMTLADRLIIMNAGRVEQIGRPSDVYHNPASRFVADFIGSPAMNLIEGQFDAKGAFNHGKGGRLSTESGLALAGRKITLGVRPEAVRRAQAGSNGAVAAVVDYVEELGASRLIYADADGSRLIAVDNGTGHLPSGTKLHFTFSEQDVHLFGEDGRRIETHASAARMAAHANKTINA